MKPRKHIAPADNPDPTAKIDFAFASGVASSDRHELHGWLPTAIKTPADIEGLSTLTLKSDGVTVYDAVGSALTITLGTDRWIVLDPTTVPALRNLQLVGDTTTTGALTLEVFLRKLND